MRKFEDGDPRITTKIIEDRLRRKLWRDGYRLGKNRANGSYAVIDQFNILHAGPGMSLEAVQDFAKQHHGCVRITIREAEPEPVSKWHDKT